MWLILRLAARNLTRNRRRSFLTLLAVLIPVVLLDISWGFIGAFERSLFEDTVRLQTGHLQIHKAGYKKIGQTIPLMRDVRPALEALAQEPAIEWFTTRLELPALIASGSRSKGVLVQGIEPEKAREISLIQNWVKSGRYLTDTDQKVAVVGTRLIEELKLNLDQSFVVLSSHPETGTGVLLPKLIGAINAPMREVNRGIVLINLSDARQMLKSENAATSVIVIARGIEGIKDADKINVIATALQQRLGDDYVVETWEQLAPEILGYLRIARPIMLAFMIIFFLLAGLVVLNTIFLNLLERTREMGVILALGVGRKRVLRMVFAEALVLSGIGALLGSLMGVGLVLWGANGVDMPGIYEDIYQEVGVNPVLKLAITPAEAVISALLMIVIALISAWLPARRAAKLEPVQAMRST